MIAAHVFVSVFWLAGALVHDVQARWTVWVIGIGLEVITKIIFPKLAV